jgi:hypothetical protein
MWEEEEGAIRQWCDAIKQYCFSCFNCKKTSRTRCWCLQAIDTDVMVKWLIYMAKCEKKQRTTFYKQFMTTSIKKRKVVITLPGIPGNPIICSITFRNLFALSVYQYSAMLKELAGGITGPKEHHLRGKSNRHQGSVYSRCKEGVVEWLAQYGKEFGEPTATRFIRETTGIGVRDTEIDLVHLPSHFSKRGIYGAYVHQNGYQLPKATHKGSLGAVKNYKLRTDDEDDTDWPPAMEPNEVVSLTVFVRIWKDKCPLIVIKPKSEDICGDCYVFANQLKYGEKRKAGDHGSGSDNEDGNEDELVVDNDNDGEQDDPNIPTRAEQLIQQAAAHVEAAIAMRKFINKRTEDSQLQKTNNVEHELMCYTIVVDYAQNMDVPHFGSQQPGETYYYSPKSIYVFGVCDVSVKPTALYAYCYEEETARKGGNNVASMIMLHLEQKGLLPVGQSGIPLKAKRLTIACDNCAGQNKNNMVIRLANFLVEKKHFDEVEVLFFIRGHTKNACDRCFNLMKIKFHDQNIYTFNHHSDRKNLMNVIARCEDVNPVSVGVEVFRDWDAHLNKLYTRLKDGSVKVNHSFRVQASEGATVVQTKLDESDNIAAISQNIKKGGVTDTERLELLQQVPDQVNPPGLNKLKQVDLYKKWRPLLPPRFRDITCPKPPDTIALEVQEERRTKARHRQQKKKAEKAGTTVDAQEE